MAPVIEIKDLVVEYDKKRALDGLCLSVNPGEIFGFLGPNGAGKSTAIKTILGLVFPNSGQVRLHGLPPEDVRSRAAVGFLPEEATYYKFLTPVEILRFYGTVCGVSSRILKERTEKLLDLVGLAAVAGKKVSTFSKGMAQKIGLAQALIHDPATLILDEPTSGLDPLSRMELRNLLRKLRQEGKTIFFSSHELSEVELLCDTIAIIKSGKLVKAGPLHKVVGPQEQSLERFFLKTIEETGP
jgi:ABC-2 type transport system ATP-binding protein